ncbi:EcsC family protein [Clostridium cylindrosporum]|uniref:EcsC protein family n=1 Tax=Clostridium cylindrosporum DSM 605 TaxID=1121307 RepID=A0A0J8D9S2_CLOCY|nr:EcsC family protein [Clostridium cylindrosporum]KMT22587.1 EcsC protein family [Clostridium cylindrosporum DSM 605]
MDYESKVIKENIQWQEEMKKPPKSSSIIAKSIQNKVNSMVPEKVHEIITDTIKNMIKMVLKGSEFISSKPYVSLTLKEREYLIDEKVKSYRKGGVIAGAGIGAGGIILGLADFPVLVSIKIKLLFDIALIYGFDVTNLNERLYILNIFKLAFSSDEKRRSVYLDVANWEEVQASFPNNYEDFDWRDFQQEYRDYIDISKMLQLLPVVGAAFGAAANYKLLNRLSYIAKNAYRLRILKQKGLL